MEYRKTKVDINTAGGSLCSPCWNIKLYDKPSLFFPLISSNDSILIESILGSSDTVLGSLWFAVYSVSYERFGTSRVESISVPNLSSFQLP